MIEIVAPPAVGDSFRSTSTCSTADGVFAVRFRGQRSFGRNPDFLYFGGNSEMRVYEYLEFIGQAAFFGNGRDRVEMAAV